MVVEDTSKPEKSAKVRVLAPYRVVHNGTAHVKGTLTVPENVAQEWERSGYVECVTGKS
jgi:hypothetical protein